MRISFRYGNIVEMYVTFLASDLEDSIDMDEKMDQLSAEVELARSVEHVRVFEWDFLAR